MRITRTCIRKQVKRVRDFLCLQERLKNKGSLYCAARSVCRSQIFINFNRDDLLESVDFFTEGDHWAETDGSKIWLNRCKSFDNDTLYWTILHETLHGMVKRSNGFEVSEITEHRIMSIIDKSLI